MPQQVAAIRSVSKAYKVIKEISSQGVPWGDDYRFYSRIAVKQLPCPSAILSQGVNRVTSQGLHFAGCG